MKDYEGLNDLLNEFGLQRVAKTTARKKADTAFGVAVHRNMAYYARTRRNKLAGGHSGTKRRIANAKLPAPAEPNGPFLPPGLRIRQVFTPMGTYHAFGLHVVHLTCRFDADWHPAGCSDTFESSGQDMLSYAVGRSGWVIRGGYATCPECASALGIRPAMTAIGR